MGPLGRIWWISGGLSRHGISISSDHIKHSSRSFRLISGMREKCFGQPAAETHPHLIAEGEVTPGLNQKEFYKRRCNLIKLAAQSFKGVRSVMNHLFVFPSAPTVYMSNDIPYVFRQNTDFLYFCGFQEPDSVLLIEAGEDAAVDGKHISTLFVPSKDPERELWDGPRSGAEGAMALTGVDAGFVCNKLSKYLEYYNSEFQDYALWYSLQNPVNVDLHKQVVEDFIQDRQYKFLENSQVLSHRLRSVKSNAEAQLMRKSAKIACDSFKEVMKFSKPGVNESALWAKMDYECRIGGAEFLAYPPVVAGGDRANIIHYITNNQIVCDGDLVLMDAGCEYRGYASDLTRTWPVSGKFTEPQKKVYNAVLRIQESCIQQCTTSNSLDSIFNHMLSVMADELVNIGIAHPTMSREKRIQMARKYCPHHVGHYLGMDVHDTSKVSRLIALQPGMVITVEPGIYIPRNDFDVAPELRGIGIRIEDDILITGTVPINLSEACPKTVEDIESLCNGTSS